MDVIVPAGGNDEFVYNHAAYAGGRATRFEDHSSSSGKSGDGVPSGRCRFPDSPRDGRLAGRIRAATFREHGVAVFASTTVPVAEAYCPVCVREYEWIDETAGNYGRVRAVRGSDQRSGCITSGITGRTAIWESRPGGHHQSGVTG